MDPGILTTETLVSADELFSHPEWNPCELLRGKVVFMSPAGGEHGGVAAEILGLIRDFVKPRKLGKVYAAETGFFLARDPDTVRAPDVSFIAKHRIPARSPRGYIPVVPDLTVEVLSPSDTVQDLDKKALEFLEAGVPLVWGVDPITRTGRVYWRGRPVIVLNESQAFSGEDILPGCEMKLKDIFEPEI
ncbi:MAG TPA: Uma2 family endonuclease [Planctomycetota bacterium]|nr:Uma2 family endonuclease [Planctomycetota bacterium]